MPQEDLTEKLWKTKLYRTISYKLILTFLIYVVIVLLN